MFIRFNIGFLGLLGLLFIGLKLGGIIHWPWLWVLCPLWLPIALTIAGVLVALVIALIALTFIKLFLKDILKMAKPYTNPAEKNVTE